MDRLMKGKRRQKSKALMPGEIFFVGQAFVKMLENVLNWMAQKQRLEQA